MREQGSEYEFDPVTDIARMNSVHAVITAHPEEFREAAEELDSYSEDRVRRYLRVANPEDRERLVGDPETLAGQFEFYLDTLSYRLAGASPNPGWGWAADVLLAYWIACCPDAEKAPKLTRFQDWAWEPVDGTNLSRRQFQLLQDGSFWRRITSAVDKSLTIAERKKLVAKKRARRQAQGAVGELPELNQKELAAHNLLLGLDPLLTISSGDICSALAKRGVSLADDVFRGTTVPKLRKLGLEAGSRGYRYPPGCTARRAQAPG